MQQCIQFNDDDSFSIFCYEHNILLYMSDIMTCKIKGTTYYDGEVFHILVNNKSSFEQQRKTVIHELAHILKGHFICEEKDREKCEREVHQIMHDYKGFYEKEVSRLGSCY